ncbi:MAG: SprT family zinc-dependent metalloprotease [Planctomycetota bacterium]
MESITTVIGRSFLKRTNRRTLAISVMPDGTVEIVAPLNAGIPEIQAKIKKRSVWINRQRRYFLTLNAERRERRYCTGATHRYLGRQYRLKVALANKPGVKLQGAYFHIGLRAVSGRAVAALLSGWMRERAREQFELRLVKWRRWCSDRGLPEPQLYLLAMPKRWGSTHLNGHMYLNPDLVRVPAPCIDYVIMHEICHIKHPRHDRGFYAELEKLCPRWRAIKQRLEMSEF